MASESAQNPEKAPKLQWISTDKKVYFGVLVRNGKEKKIVDAVECTHGIKDSAAFADWLKSRNLGTLLEIELIDQPVTVQNLNPQQAQKLNQLQFRMAEAERTAMPRLINEYFSGSRSSKSEYTDGYPDDEADDEEI